MGPTSLGPRGDGMLSSMSEDRRGGARPGPWGLIACAWALVFAAAHFYWALGGDLGLAVSAGPLAEERPGWFVLVGLWGVGALCLVGAALGWLLGESRPAGAAGRVVTALGWCACAVLLARGLAVEALLLFDTAGRWVEVSAEQRLWTLLLWNPWFVVGGLAFGLAARGPGRTRNPRAPTG